MRTIGLVMLVGVFLFAADNADGFDATALKLLAGVATSMAILSAFVRPR